LTAACQFEKEYDMSFFSDLLKDFPALEVARERIKLVEDKQRSVEEENQRLRQTVATLQADIAALRLRLPSTEFVERRGAIFKRLPTGGFESVAYCPDCKRALSTLEDFIPLSCSKCNYIAPLRGPEIPAIIQSLEA
jgi:hypothetical protein